MQALGHVYNPLRWKTKMRKESRQLTAYAVNCRLAFKETVAEPARKQLLEYTLTLWFLLGIPYPTVRIFWPFTLLVGIPTQWRINMTYIADLLITDSHRLMCISIIRSCFRFAGFSMPSTLESRFPFRRIHDTQSPEYSTYITNHDGAGKLISRIDRHELLREMVQHYFS